MSLCIGIRENQLREVASVIDKDKYKFKFLYDSDNHVEFHQQLGIQVLRDNIMFSGSVHRLSATKVKLPGQDAKSNLSLLINDIFEDERQISIVNDFYQHQYLVLVFTNVYEDPSEKRGNTKHTTLTDDKLDELIYKFLTELNNREGIPTSTWNLYNSGSNKDDDIDMTYFLNKQKHVNEEKKNSYKIQLINHFEESYKFRLITIYTKLRDYDLNDIMRKLDEFGYLDSRFKDEIFVYEEEARRLLARRLCTMSFKDDIQVLINKGVMSKDRINYTF